MKDRKTLQLNYITPLGGTAMPPSALPFRVGTALFVFQVRVQSGQPIHVDFMARSEARMENLPGSPLFSGDGYWKVRDVARPLKRVCCDQVDVRNGW